jgi:uroporphyrinogen decarboxylase
LNAYERVFEALNLGEPDRVPLWIIGGPYMAKLSGYKYDEFCRDPEKIASANKNFMEKYDTDISYIFTDTWYTHEGWGMKLRWSSSSPPVPTSSLIKEAEDYEKLWVLDPYKDGRMPVMIKAIELLSKQVGQERVVAALQFSPLSFLAHVRGFVRSMIDLLLYPELVHKGLDIITQTVIEFLRASAEAGVDLILYHNAREDYSLLTKKHVEEFGIKYDRRVLNELKRLGVPVVLHMCGPEPMIDLVISEYPGRSFLGVQFWDRGANISLRKAKELFGDKICLIAGFDNVRTMTFGKPEDVYNEAKEALETAKPNGGFILSSGCEISRDAPEENLYALTKAIRDFGYYQK